MRIFHLYKGFHRKKTSEGFFIKGSSRVVEPPRIEYKGFKYKYKIKGDICRSWLVRTSNNLHAKDGKSVRFSDNAGININKKVNIMSKYINGPVAKNLKKKKLVSLFRTTL